MHKNKSIFLHIGTKKTGSTTIQNFLCHNQKKLYDLGFDYPTEFSEKVKTAKSYGMMGLPQSGNLHEIFINWMEGDENSPPIENLASQIDADINKNIVLSSENFYFFAFNKKDLVTFKETLSKKFPNHNWKIIVYLRRQDEYVESLYSQEMKDGCMTTKTSSEDYISNKEFELTLNYQSFLNVYAELFGKENIIVRPYEKAQFKNENILFDFCNILGVKEDNLIVDLKSNPPLDHKVTEFLRLAKKYIQPEQKMISAYISKFCKPHPTEKIDLLDPELKFKLYKKHLASNNEIAKAYLGKDTLFLKEPKKTSGDWKPFCFTVEDAVQVTSLILAELTKNDINNSQTIKKLVNQNHQIIQILAKNKLI